MKNQSNKSLPEFRLNSLNEYKSRIISVINFINNNLHEKITLEQLSSAACFSPFHFHRIFAALIGETPSDFLNRVRLEKAANLLITNSSLTITQFLSCADFPPRLYFRAHLKNILMCLQVRGLKTARIAKLKASKVKLLVLTKIIFPVHY